MAGIRDDVRSTDDDEEELDESELDALDFDEDEIDQALGLTGQELLLDDDEDEAHDSAGEAETSDADTGAPDGTETEPPQEEGEEQQAGEGDDAPPAGTHGNADEAAPSPAQPGTQAGTAATTTDNAGTAGTTGTATAADPEPLRYRAGGKEYVVEGSRVTDEGVFIPKTALRDVQYQLSQGRHHMTTWQQERQVLEQRAQAAETYKSEAEIAFTEHMKAYREMIEEVNRTGDTTPLEQFLDNYRTQLPLMDARAERAVLEYERRAGKAATAPAEGREAGREAGADPADELGVAPEEIERQVTALVPQTLNALRDVPELMDISDEAVAATQRLLGTGLLQRFFAVATRDDPTRGVTRGAILADQAALARFLREQENIIREQRRVRSTADQAAERNRKRGVVVTSAGPGAAPKHEAAAAAAKAAGHIPLLPAHNDREAFDRWSELPLSVREASSKQGRRAPKGKWTRDLKG